MGEAGMATARGRSRAASRIISYTLWQMLFKSLLLTVLQQGVAAQADDATTLLQLKADIGLTDAAAWSGSQPCAAGVMAAGTAAAGSDGQGQAFTAVSTDGGC